MKRWIATSLILLLLPLTPMQVLAQQYYPPNQQPVYQQPQAYGQQPYSSQQQPQPYQNYGQNYGQAPAQQQQPLSAPQLEQLVAPIALYPDPLVAQVLTASTYPNQVTDADRWRQSMGNAPAEQIAAGADAQNWDPSVKALTAFPQVLEQMDRNLRWTSDLGTAYYNQPQDVLQAVQGMRQRAQAAGNLQSTPQEIVNYDQGNIEVAPANPQVVYVPAYNPWAVYGQPIKPYPGFSLLGAVGSFLGSVAVSWGPGILMAAFNSTPFGFIGWGLSWLAHAVLFHQSNYCSYSTTVADWGFAYGGRRAFQSGGLGYAGGYARGYAGAYARGYDRGGYAGGYDRGFGARGYQSPAGYSRPVQQSYNRMQPAFNNNRPSSFWGARPPSSSAYTQPRTPAAVFHGNSFAPHAPAAYQNKNFASFSNRGEHAGGGFHPFGGGSHAPKGFGGGHSGGGHFGGGNAGGGHSGGHGGGGHWFGKHR